jgi:hypothetical protein
MGQRSLRDATISVLDGDSQRVTVKIGSGSFAFSEKRTVNHTLNKGQLDITQEGDDSPVDVSFDFVWDKLKPIPGYVAPYNAPPVTPVAWYKMDDYAESTVVLDAMGGASGTSVKDTIDMSVAGNVGNALSFDGSDCIDTGQTFQSIFRDSFSISFDVLMTDGNPAADNFFIATSLDAVNQSAFFIENPFITNEKASIQVGYKSKNTSEFLVNYIETEDPVFTNGIQPWKHITVTFDKLSAITMQVKIYVDGLLIKDSGVRDMDMPLYTSTGNLCFGGAYAPELTFPFSGNLNNIMIFDSALTQQEVTDLYNHTWLKSDNTNLRDIIRGTGFRIQEYRSRLPTLCL